MRTHIAVPFVVVVWLVIGVVVALNKNYGDINNGSQAATFALAVVLWPIPATGGRVAIVF